MLKLAPFVLVAALGTGCFHMVARQRFEVVATPAPDSDFVLVRTRDHNHYYLIDAARRLCFLHTRLYGREHMVPFDCANFRDYEQVLEDDAARRGPRVARTEGDPAPEVAPGTAAAPEPVVAPDEERPEDQAFRRAYVQLECSRREKAEEPLEVVLERFKLSREAWDQGTAALTEDDRAALAEDADATCPPAQ